jgi:hypothetical protein
MLVEPHDLDVEEGRARHQRRQLALRIGPPDAGEPR